MTDGEGQSHWWRISVTVALDAADRVEETLDVLGALAITRMDAGDAPQFDAALPDKPRWPLQSVSGLFAPDTDMASIEEPLMDVAGSDSALGIDAVADQDWELSGRTSFAPVQISDRLWICPPWNPLPDSANQIQVTITPGLAFGTGTHATTQLCLQQIECHSFEGSKVLDWGCGSGVLAIAALRLGAGSATGVDLDPKAMMASRENALLNGVAGTLDLCTPDALSDDARYDLVVANILAGTIMELATTLEQHLKPQGVLILSGILAAQVDRVRTSFAQYNLTSTYREEWACL
ncbi:MAG: 50S ribosomal protein L11 methyltransferase, partial [Pseudomonadota bacterium]|nr:50S ribosomal protein L11 methyltransferase [Pseudomonadota bacterium]